jgi:type II secretory pathway pseudopilin PulG
MKEQIIQKLAASTQLAKLLFRRVVPNSQFQIPHSKQQGFTLIEAVVSAAVFAFTITSIVGVYLSVMSIDTKTRAERSVQQNARFIMDFLGKEIRNGNINYSAYPGGTVTYKSGGYATDLFITNQLNENEQVTCGSDSGSDPNDPYLILTKASGATNLNSQGVRVTNCKFFISPSTTPFAPLADSPPNVQPSVTVVLQLTANYGNRAQNKAVANLETTFTVRQYPSR